ncbi:MAG: hypothetical protein HUJ98_06405, partial [Bacteroidaceae bacterium]|nr:hypothetical protein [Bacteroidaceae bacterium]
MRFKAFFSKHIQTVTFVAVLFCIFIAMGSQKDIWFGDEVLTFESANFDSTEGLDEFESNGGAGVWMDGQEFTNRWSVTDNKLGFEIIKRDLYDDHVPLYFFLVNIVSFVVKGSCSKWIPLSINFFFACVAGLSLLKLLQKKWEGVATVLLTLSVAAHPVIVEQLTFARMYMMFSAILVLMLIFVNEDNLDRWKTTILLGILITAGLLTHYYFWVFDGIFAAVMFVSLLIQKKWMPAVRLVTANVEALALTTLLFPQWTYRIRGGNGATALGNILSFEYVFEEVKEFVTVSADMIAPGIGLLILVLMVAAFVAFVIKDKGKTRQLYLVVISSVLFILFVIHTTPNGQVERYILPAATVLMGVTAYVLLDLFHDKKIVLIVLSGILLAGSLVLGLNGNNIDYLTLRTKEERAVLYDKADVPWIAAGSMEEWRMTCVSYDFRIPKKIMLWNSQVPVQDDEVLKNADEMVIYVRQ